jgi:hypothetical protein
MCLFLMIRLARGLGTALFGIGALLVPRLDAGLTGVRMLADEIITTTTPAHNGASPMWSAGAPLLVRENGNVWASISMHDAGAPPYCNTHWELWRRPEGRVWEKVRQGPEASEREPRPIFRLNDQSLVVSIHPKILTRDVHQGGEQSWYCQPALAVYDPTRDDRAARLWLPDLGPSAPFGQHSYRGVGVDAERGEFCQLVIDREDVFRATWRDRTGNWHPLAPPTFPIRACYPVVELRNRATHIFAIGDIKEPNASWREEKARVLQREWDYVFRRLFYTWSPDLSAEPWCEPLEIDSVEETAGWMFNLDMVSDAQDRVHLLWVRRTVEHDFLRDRFFPGQPIIESVLHAVIEQGRVTARETLLSRQVAGDRRSGGHFSSGRFHALPDGRMVAVLATELAQDGESAERVLLLQELDPQAQRSAPPVRVALARPLPPGSFFTNTTRGGSKPDHHLDLLAAETNGDIITLRYLHVFIP